MFRYRRSNRHSVVLLALALLLIQTYVLYSSTFHVFHHSMPMCPVCVAMKSYHGSIVDTAVTVFDDVKYFILVVFPSPQINRFIDIPYQPRAPPSLILL